MTVGVGVGVGFDDFVPGLPAMTFEPMTTPALPPFMTLTRASNNATYFDNAGVLQTAATNAPRFDYNPATLLPCGLLIEPARTNKQLDSQDTTTINWVTKTDLTPSLAQGIAPDGTNTMNLLTEGSAGTALIAGTAVTTLTSGATFTTSIFAKRGNTDWVQFRAVNNAVTDGGRAWFNLATGTVGTVVNLGTATGSTARITPVGNGIYRLEVTTTIASNTTAKLLMFSAASDNSNTRVAGATYYVWGGQNEEGAVATSHIKTGGAPATRAGDICSIADTSTMGFNASEGTLLCSFIAEGVVGTEQCIFGVSDGSNNNCILMRMASSGAIVADITTSGSGVAANNSTVIPAGLAVYKAALAYEVNDIALSVNGAAAVTDGSAALPTVTKGLIGLNRTLGGGQLCGWIQRAAYYTTRLPNATLQALTA